MAGIYNHVGGSGRGVTMAGVMNYSGRDYTGLRMAFILDAVRNNFKGLQMSGVYSHVGGELHGVQISFIGNYVNSNIHGSQYAGIFNGARMNMRGLQAAGIMNMTRGFMSGAQMAGIGNIAGDVHGVQMSGIFNKAKHVQGTQIAAILNIADHSDCPIGLINIIRDGEMSIGVTYDMTGNIVLAFRSGGRVMYGIIGIGYNPDTEDGIVWEGGIGAHINILRWFKINNELTVTNMDMLHSSVSQASYSLLPAFRIGQHFELFAGPSFNYMYTQSDKGGNANLFPQNSVWKKVVGEDIQQMFIGFKVGAQYVF